jgi:hypothetical protein
MLYPTKYYNYKRRKNMANKFWIPKTLYNELNKAAEQKGQTLQQYLDDLLGALICGQLS